MSTRGAFRDLHRDSIFVMPNPFDVGSARILESVGFEAVATTSSGHAASLGRLEGAGLARLPDIYTRLHGPTKATTLGIGSILLGSLLFFSLREGLSLHELLVSLFLFLTAPVSAHLIARAALQRRNRSLARVP